jgi:hypothetical protein
MIKIPSWGKWAAIGAAAVAVVALMKRGASASTSAVPEIEITPSFTPAAVGANELVSVGKYRLIDRRSIAGLSYVPVTKGGWGETVEFKSPTAGKFTFNLIEEGGKLYAEIAS